MILEDREYAFLGVAMVINLAVRLDTPSAALELQNDYSLEQ